MEKEKKKKKCSLLDDLELKKKKSSRKSKLKRMLFKEKEDTHYQIFFRNSIWEREYLENVSPGKLDL